MSKRIVFIILIAVIVVAPLIMGANGVAVTGEGARPTKKPSHTPKPSNTPNKPTNTPTISATPLPSLTPLPSATPRYLSEIELSSGDTFLLERKFSYGGIASTTAILALGFITVLSVATNIILWTTKSSLK